MSDVGPNIVGITLEAYGFVIKSGTIHPTVHATLGALPAPLGERTMDDDDDQDGNELPGVEDQVSGGEIAEKLFKQISEIQNG